MNKKTFYLFLYPALFFFCFGNGLAQQDKTSNDILMVTKSTEVMVIDGIANESVWQEALWHPIDQLWLGSEYSDSDFQGRYKLAWTEEGLYLLAEITDDVLSDQYPNPLENWWDDDCLEIFIDENNSGGIHQYNHSAFAYHVALDGNVVDMSTQKKGKLYNTHVISKRLTEGTTSIWELKILVFDESYKDDSNNTPVRLHANKKVGFALAYCDNDSSEFRENFVGSLKHEEFKKNRGWIDASIFGTLILKD